MTTRATWQAAERCVADYFGTKRTPLSGGGGSGTRSDTLHDDLFLEVKYRDPEKKSAFRVVRLWRDTHRLAREERKTPVLALREKGTHGFWLMMHSSDLQHVAACALDAQGESTPQVDAHRLMVLSRSLHESLGDYLDGTE